MTKRFVEENISFVESVKYNEADESATITVFGITADEINQNRRVYPKEVLKNAVMELQESLGTTSARSGRKLVTAEMSHPQTNEKATLKETVVFWTDAMWSEERNGPIIIGETPPTSQGREFARLARWLYNKGLPIPVSQRARGDASFGIWNGQRAEVMEALVINGYDFCLQGSDVNAYVVKLESEETEMDLDTTVDSNVEEVAEEIVEETLAEEETAEPVTVTEEVTESDPVVEEEPVVETVEELIDETPEAVEEELSTDDTQMSELQEKLESAQMILEEVQNRNSVMEAELWLAKQEIPNGWPEVVRENLRLLSASNLVEAQALWESKLEEYKNIVEVINEGDAAKNEASAFESGKVKAMETLEDRGMNNGGRITEMTEGWEERISPLNLQFNEEMAPAVKEIVGVMDKLEASSNGATHFNPRNPRKNASHELAKVMLESYLFNNEERIIKGVGELNAYRAKQSYARKTGTTFNEAPTLRTAFNLPYLVMAGILPEVYASLVSPQVFMVKPLQHETERYYVEGWGATPTANVTDEVVVCTDGAWVDLAHGYIRRNSVVVTTSPAGTTYVNGTDYVIDYEEGRLYTIAAGAMVSGANHLVDYTYALIAEGENAPIELVSTLTNYETLQVSAKRLGFNITDEAVRFALSDISYDARGNHLANAVYRLAQELDTKMFEAAETYGLMSGMKTATWYQTPQGTDTIDENLRLLVDRISDASNLMDQYYYQPTHVVMTNNIARKFHRTDLLDTDTQRRGVNIDSEFYLGQIHGLPVFRVPYGQYHDGYVLVLSGRDTVVKGIYSPLEIVGGTDGFINRATSGDTNRLVASRGWYVQEYNDVVVPVDPTDSSKTRRIAVIPVGA